MFGTECGPWRIFPTSLTGDVTSKIADDDWERGCVRGACAQENGRGLGRKYFADKFALLNLLNVKGCVKEDSAFKFYEQESS